MLKSLHKNISSSPIYSDYTDNKTMYEKDENRVITAWKHTVRIKLYVIGKLTTEAHRIAIVCAGQK